MLACSRKRNPASEQVDWRRTAFAHAGMPCLAEFCEFCFYNHLWGKHLSECRKVLRHRYEIRCPSRVTGATKLSIDRFAAPFHEESGSAVCASALPVSANETGAGGGSCQIQFVHAIQETPSSRIFNGADLDRKHGQNSCHTGHDLRSIGKKDLAALRRSAWQFALQTKRRSELQGEVNLVPARLTCIEAATGSRSR